MDPLLMNQIFFFFFNALEISINSKGFLFPENFLARGERDTFWCYLMFSECSQCYLRDDFVISS